MVDLGCGYNLYIQNMVDATGPSISDGDLTSVDGVFNGKHEA